MTIRSHFRRVLPVASLLALGLVGGVSSALAQITWDTANSNAPVGNGSTWSDAGNWIGGILPGPTNDIIVNGGNISVTSAASYRQGASGTAGTVTIQSGGTLTTFGTFSAVRYLGPVTVKNGGVLRDGNEDSASLRSNTTVETGGRVEGFNVLRDSTLTLAGGTFAPLGADLDNARNLDMNSSGKLYISSGALELDVYGDDDSEYLNLVASSAIASLGGGSGGDIVLVPRDGYVPTVGDSFDLWDNPGGGSVTPGDGTNITMQGHNVTFDTSAWASTGEVTITSLGSGAVSLYNSDFQTDRTADFLSPVPASLRHDPAATHPGTANGAMLLGQPGDNFVSVTLRVPAEAGKNYEVISRTAVNGTGSNTVDQYVKLVNASGTALYTSPNQATGDDQVLVPPTGTAPAGTAFIQVTYTLRGLVAAGTTRHIEIAQLQITQLGASGPRPFLLRNPYINHVLGYVGVPVSVNMTDTFAGTISSWSNDAGIPMTFSGNTVTFTPTATRPHEPGFSVIASNSAGAAIQGATLYLQVDPAPANLAVATPDPAALAQLVHQYVEPGQVLFPIDCDRLFTGGLPPFSDSIVSKPAWVEMPVNGLVGGRCPTNATPTATNIVIKRTDARGHNVNYTLNVSVIAARSRVPTHYPTTGTALTTAISSGGRVVQLAANTVYTFGNLYGSAQTTSSASNPCIILGAPGAKIRATNLNSTGHHIFENVAFELAAEGDLLAAKSARGVRLKNCTFTGYTIPVNLNDGTPWVRTDPFRYAGNGIVPRDNTFMVVDGCTFQQLNTALNTTSNPAGVGIFNTVSQTVADDHCFFQQVGALWLENVDLLGHGGNHTTGEHRDIIQFGNANQPAVRHALLRRVFGYGDGASQACFLENETQRSESTREPYWIGNHRDVLVEHCAFVGNAAHGISIRAHLGFTVRNCLTIGHPDEFYMGGSDPAYGNLLIRSNNQNGLIQNTIADFLSYDNQVEATQNGVVLSNNLILNNLAGGYVANRAPLFPAYTNTSLPMKQRVKFSTTWATANPTLGPDILR